MKSHYLVISSELSEDGDSGMDEVLRRSGVSPRGLSSIQVYRNRYCHTLTIF